MKILQMLPGFTLGGPTFSTTMLARCLQGLGHRVLFFTEENDFAGYEDLDFHPFHVPAFPLNGQFAFSWGLLKELKRECRDAQIIQTNSLWQFPNIVQEYARKGCGAKSVIVPRGTLSEYALSMSRKKKKLVYALGQRMALRRADMFIATCEKEYRDIRNFGLTQPVAIIPNGLELPVLEGREKKNNVTFLGRIHKVKGVDLLIEAWKRIRREGGVDDWRLVIAGPTMSDYAKEMQELARGEESISFVGELHGEAKNRLLEESAIYVLPTHTENFGISVGEALACGTAAITTTGAPWSGLVDNDCGLWIDLSVENLAKALTNMMSLPMDRLSAMGRNGREWMRRDFSWDEIAQKTAQAYEWLLYPEDRELPDFVRID